MEFQEGRPPPLLLENFLCGCNAFLCPFIVVQLPSCVRLFATPWSAAHQASSSFTFSQSLLKLLSIKSVMPSNHLILCLPLPSCPQSFPASRSFPVSLRIRWPEYWSFSFSISPSNEHSGLISFRMDSFDLLAAQGDSQESSPAQFERINYSASLAVPLKCMQIFFLRIIYLAVLGSISMSFFTSRNPFRLQGSTEEVTEKNQDVSQPHLIVFGLLGTRGQYTGTRWSVGFGCPSGGHPLWF